MLNFTGRLSKKTQRYHSNRNVKEFRNGLFLFKPKLGYSFLVSTLILKHNIYTYLYMESVIYRYLFFGTKKKREECCKWQILNWNSWNTSFGRIFFVRSFHKHVARLYIFIKCVLFYIPLESKTHLIWTIVIVILDRFHFWHHNQKMLIKWTLYVYLVK